MIPKIMNYFLMFQIKRTSKKVSLKNKYSYYQGRLYPMTNRVQT